MAAWSERQAMAELWIDARRGGSAAFAHLSRVQTFYLWLRAQAKAAYRARLRDGAADARRRCDAQRRMWRLSAVGSRARSRPRCSAAPASTPSWSIRIQIYPPDFRCEKLDGVQVAILRKTGLADEVLRAATPDRECWVARFGRLVEKRPGDQYGIFYAPLVNTVRSLIPSARAHDPAKATAIATASERQTVTLSSGETISARLDRAGQRTQYGAAPFARPHAQGA